MVFFDEKNTINSYQCWFFANKPYLCACMKGITTSLLLPTLLHFSELNICILCTCAELKFHPILPDEVFILMGSLNDSENITWSTFIRRSLRVFISLLNTIHYFSSDLYSLTRRYRWVYEVLFYGRLWRTKTQLKWAYELVTSTGWAADKNSFACGQVVKIN